MANESKVYGIIPARLESTRLPRKLLLCETGKPLIQHTWERAIQARRLSQVIIAADSVEIADACRSFGARCELTGEHSSGTDRIAEVVRRQCHDADIVVNIQGDEPEIDPRHVDQAVDALAARPQAVMSTLATPITDPAELSDPGCVKVVRSTSGHALYFSRAPIPFVRDQSAGQEPMNLGPWLRHVGLYAYRAEFLLQFSQLRPTPLEQAEKLEQLRALENGAAIAVEIVGHSPAGIDSPQDYARFVRRLRR